MPNNSVLGQQTGEVADPRTPRLLMAGVVGADEGDSRRINVTLTGDPADFINIFKVNNFVPVPGETCVVLAQESRMVALGMVSLYAADGSGEGDETGGLALSGLSDVSLGSLSDGDALVWSEFLQAFTNRQIEAGPGGEPSAQITVSDTAPSAPQLNDLWFDIS